LHFELHFTFYFLHFKLSIMSKTKATGATKLGRDSRPKYLGVKLFAGQKVKPGMIIVRQRGTKFLAGQNVRRGADDTLYAAREGIIKFETRRKKRFDGSQRLVKIVSVK
jgi:large subunit ribosomal protein L27